MTIVSSFDIATRLTGWCSGDGTAIPSCGAFSFPFFGDDIGKLLTMWNAYLRTHFDEFKPNVVIYEAPILVIGHGKPGQHTDKLLTIRRIYSMGGHLEWYCMARGVPCFEVGPKQIKMEITGNGHAEKQTIVDVAKRIGLNLPASKSAGEEDAADAWGGWVIGLRSYEPELSRKWDAVIHNPRGKWSN